MGIYAKHDYLPHKRKWLGIIFEADSPDADPEKDRIVVLDVNTADTEQEIIDWIPVAIQNHEWETRQ